MMRVAELTGAHLDYWVARAEGIPAHRLRVLPVQRSKNAHCVHLDPNGQAVGVWNYSTDWEHGGPLVDKYRIDLEALSAPVFWRAELFSRDASFTGGEWCSDDGDTALQAICRAVVRAAFGDEVEEVAVCP
jgi:hypothetical protein